MNHLRRELAPVTEAGWAAIEDEAKTRLATYLAARMLVDFDGPHGWDHSATDLGRVAAIAGPAEGVTAAQRRLLALVELRTEFSLPRSELDDAERGADDLDLGPLDEAARRLALGENAVVFHGYAAAGFAGITEVSSHPPVTLSSKIEHYPNAVAVAVDLLRQSGIGGPYGLALEPDVFTAVLESTEHGGYLLLDHLRSILGGPVVRAPGVVGGVVLSTRGGDFVLSSGQDLSIGYLDHDDASVRLYLEESFSFRVLEPDAAVTLRLGT